MCRRWFYESYCSSDWFQFGNFNIVRAAAIERLHGYYAAASPEFNYCLFYIEQDNIYLPKGNGIYNTWFNKKFGWEYDKICRSDRVMLTNSPSLWCYLLVLFLIISPTWLEDHLIFSNFGWPAHGLGILYSPKILGEKDLWFSYIC